MLLMEYSDLLHELKRRRENLLNGKVNCIPSPFRRFSNNFVGIEQGNYYVLSASTKVGKTQLASFLFLYTPLLYAYNNQDKVRLKIMYFNLEESEQNITLRFISHLLYTYSKGKYRISTKDLKSTRADNPLDESVLQLLEEEPYKSIMDFFYKTVEFREERNPTGIAKAVENYCLDNGTIKRKTIKILNKDTGILEDVEVFDSYTPNDSELYFIPIVDHISLLNTEMGLSLKQCIDKLSTSFVKCRNRYNISPLVIQQQAASRESTENAKLNTFLYLIN